MFGKVSTRALHCRRRRAHACAVAQPDSLRQLARSGAGNFESCNPVVSHLFPPLPTLQINVNDENKARAMRSTKAEPQPRRALGAIQQNVMASQPQAAKKVRHKLPIAVSSSATLLRGLAHSHCSACG